MKFFRERLFPDHAQVFGVDAVLHKGHTGFQDSLVFENGTFGRVLALDGIVQLTERDNHIYHETISHVPLMLHGSARRVLIIGGGDGGALKEVLKHTVDEVQLVEIDSEVINLSRRFFPDICESAFDDRRVRVHVADAVRYVGECHTNFDAILIDSTDPVGPGQQLFSRDFYERCRDLLVSTGILVVQSGTAPHNPEQLMKVCDMLASSLGVAVPFVAPVPTYPGGMLALVAASWSRSTLRVGKREMHRRFQHLRGNTRYYTPEIHRAAFSMAQKLWLPPSAPRADRHSRSNCVQVDPQTE